MERPTVWYMVVADARRTYAYLTGGRLRRLLGCALSPGVQAAVVYRFGKWASCQTNSARVLLDPLYFVLSMTIRVLWGIDLPRGALIGPGLYIAHFGGIILSPDVVIGANCNLSHDVTIGLSGQGPECGCPTIGDNVYFAPGAKVFGPITIGNNVKIGANAVIHSDIPDNAVAVAGNFRIISMGGNRTTAKLKVA